MHVDMMPPHGGTVVWLQRRKGAKACNMNTFLSRRRLVASGTRDRQTGQSISTISSQLRLARWHWPSDPRSVQSCRVHLHRIGTRMWELQIASQRPFDLGCRSASSTAAPGDAWRPWCCAGPAHFYQEHSRPGQWHATAGTSAGCRQSRSPPHIRYRRGPVSQAADVVEFYMNAAALCEGRENSSYCALKEKPPGLLQLTELFARPILPAFPGPIGTENG